MWANRLAARQLPSASRVAERLAGQGTDRADVDHVPRQLAVHGPTHEGRDFAVLAAIRHAQLHHARHFLAKSNAARAMDAAAHLFHRDQRADVLVKDDSLFFLVAALGGAVANRQVLQLAFAALVANGAIKRVVDEQELHHTLLRCERLLGAGANDHAGRHRRGAGRHRLGRLLHLHKTHAAVGRDAQLLVIAKMRHIGAQLVGRMHDHAARRDFDLLAVKFDFDHWLTQPSFVVPPRSWRRTRA